MNYRFWGISTAGSAPRSQCGGHGFESRMLQERDPNSDDGFGFFCDYGFYEAAGRNWMQCG